MAKTIMDGGTAAVHIAFAMSDVATVYPITPVASMGQTAQTWGLIEGRRNLMGQPLDVRELESELGAAGATHGAARGGALATTFTASQGLLLMIPNMYKIAGEMLPVVFHVGTRSIASHALSIFGDHQDIMACRATGFAFLGSASVQETMDLALVAHLATIDGSVPVVHFFDGWRISNEMATIDAIDYETIRPLVDWDKVDAFRRAAMNPEHPMLHGSSQNPGVYFQNREACNSAYDRFPAIVQAAMDRVAKATGRSYHLVDYHGAVDADRVVVAMGSSTKVACEAVDWLNARGEKVGVVTVRLFQPFPIEAFAAALPATVKHIAVLDRTKEPGAVGEPLYLAVVAALNAAGREGIDISNGRYGLSSKEFNPSMVKAIFDYIVTPGHRRVFTVGINDDVTHLSVPVTEQIDTTPAGSFQALFYGIGADGTVGSTKLAANIIGSQPGLFAQAYFDYSAKKSGGYTLSQLRFGHQPVESAYAIEHSDYVGCNKAEYVDRFDLLSTIKEGGVFVLNSSWSPAEMEQRLPAALKRMIATRRVRFYNIDAGKVAQAAGLGVRVNTVMATVFFKLSGVIPFEQAKALFIEQVKKAYLHEGGEVVSRNLTAIDQAVEAIQPINYPSSWTTATEGSTVEEEAISGGSPQGSEATVKFVNEVARKCFELKGDELPVSAFRPDGAMPPGTAAYEKRRIASFVPQWDMSKCVECTECSLVCPHAAIRSVVMTAAEKAAAPAAMESKAGHGPLKEYQFRIQVYPYDCQGCGSCVHVCPGKALTMVPIREQLSQEALVEYSNAHISYKGGTAALSRFSINGSQLYQPLMEFSGACAGCGETPYVKLITQLFGERMIIANATGCSSIWGGSYPSNPYCVNANGHGPAWANSLFEDNAEFGYGIAAAIEQRRLRLKDAATTLAGEADPKVAKAASAWLEAFSLPTESYAAGVALVKAINAAGLATPEAKAVLAQSDLLGQKSIWAVGGDGWAYDIGFAGLDHVLASGQNINVLVLDTECYSNTGGQTSKATPLGACAKYSPLGKRVVKKDLARMMMTYTDVYVAQIALGANYQQAITALKEAEAYPGPSIVVAYCPCIEHGIRRGLGWSIIEERDAVKAGYWNLYRYNPGLKAEGKEPLTVDAPAPEAAGFMSFLNGEDRYADLKMLSPKEAAVLQPELQKHLYSVYRHMTALTSIAPA